MLMLEKKIIKYIEEHLWEFSLAFIIILAVAIRFFAKDFVSEDAQYALLPWYDEMKKSGGVRGLSQQIGNYNLIYQLLISIMTYIPIKPLYAYKILSCIFDFVLGIAVAGYVGEKEIHNKKWKMLFAYAMVVISPIVFINSGIWAQCDSIYVFFAVLAIICLSKERYKAAFIFLGISFSFKLQAVFVLPLFLFVYFINKKFSILYFLIIPLTMILSGLPAYCFGRSILDIFRIYLEQSDTYKTMYAGYPSFWAIFLQESNVNQYNNLRISAMLVTVLVLAVIMLYLIMKKIKITNDNLIYIGFILSYACVLFLPSMHERYGYLFEILSIIIVFKHKKTAPLLIALWTISLYSYSIFLFKVDINLNVLAVFNCCVFILYTFVLIKKMLESDTLEIQTKQ